MLIICKRNPFLALSFFFSIFLTLQSCGEYKKEKKPPYTLKEIIYVDRLTDDNYLLSLKQNKPFKVYVGENISTINWNKVYNLSEQNNNLKIENKNKNKRLYFAAINANDTLYFSEREIDMSSTVNFRDLGGILTKNGKQVKWGMLYRSGDLPELSEEDMNYMKELNIKTICDLRSTEEIKEKPDMYPNGVNWIHVPIGNLDGKNTKEMFKKLKDADPETFDGDKIMADLSSNFILSKSQFKLLFDNLLTDNTPLLFHCTAGKDRTGYSSALILSALGVDEETIFNEYLLSEN